MRVRLHLLSVFIGFALLYLIADRVFGGLYSLRFVYAPLNWCVLAALFTAIPITLFAQGAFARNAWLRFWLLVGAALLLIPCIILAACSCLEAYSNVRYPSLQLQDAKHVGWAVYRDYADNSAPLAPPTTIVRKEFDLCCGLKIVREVWSDGKNGMAKLRSTDGNAIEVSIDGSPYQTIR